MISAAAGVARIARERRGRRVLLLVAVATLLVVVLFPFAWMVQMSFRTSDDIFGYDLLFAPTLENYRALWVGTFPGSFVNSVAAGTISTALSLLIGVPAAYSLSRWRFRSRRGVALWILATRMAPPIAFTIPFFLAYRYVGLLDTIAGLVVIYMTFNLALVVWMMQSFFDGVPRALEEAAWIDGCGVWGAFRRIALPLAAPGLAATAVLCFIFSWNDFFYALILTRTNAMTAPVAIVNFMQYEGWEWGKIAAGGTLVMLPVVVFTFFVRAYLVRGLTAGGVKD
ncbi:MAG TPA: carbohydrate ABC transporter permease [Candidatus Sulfotelmatobacter sp.]|nr:carbohydrate ABC transporter permease [Candidatus Sulfotelmatobacter sp.]